MGFMYAWGPVDSLGVRSRNARHRPSELKGPTIAALSNPTRCGSVALMAGGPFKPAAINVHRLRSGVLHTFAGPQQLQYDVKRPGLRGFLALAFALPIVESNLTAAYCMAFASSRALAGEAMAI